MKLSVFLLLCSIGLAQATDSYAQKATVNLEMRNQTVKEVLDEIEEQSDFSFFFNIKHVDLHRRVSVVAKKSDIFKVLETVFAGTDVRYSVVDRKIILSTEKQEIQQINQDKKVTGVIKDQHGEPVIGANVIEKGTSNGVITDLEGNFSLSVSEKAVLQISYIGYETKEVKVTGSEKLHIVLKEDTQTLDEVVVVGYGTQKKINLTGAVSAVQAEKFQNRAAPTLSTMLSGLASGVTVRQSSGNPGSDGASILIRGAGTFSGDYRAPLILIDGAVADMNSVNPEDVENISILKDAASAAIYGARGANGVVLVTTKKGTPNAAPRVTYTGTFTQEKASGIFEFLTDYADYMELYNMAELSSNPKSLNTYDWDEIAAWRAAKENPNGMYTDPNTGHQVPNYLAYPNTNWSKLLFAPNFSHKHNLSVSGGSQNSNYLLSFGYFDNPGTLDNTGVNQFNIRLNAESRITKFLKIGTQTYAIRQRKAPGDVSSVNSNRFQTVGGMVAYHDGKYGGPESPREKSDVRNLLKDVNAIGGENATTRINTTWFAEINPLEGLTARASLNYQSYFYDTKTWTKSLDDYSFRTGNVYRPGVILSNATTSRSSERNERYTATATINYNTKFLKDHEISVLAGYEQFYYNTSEFSARKKGLLNFGITDITTGLEMDNISGYAESDYALVSFFGRLNYAYKNRYLLEANIRRDGSSRFSPDHRWGTFPSFSLGWRVSEEPFFESAKRYIDNLKLKASWGQLGNTTSGYYDWQATYNKAPYVFGNVISDGMKVNKIANLLLEWESVTSKDFGFEASFLRSRLSLEFDYYDKLTKGILTSPSIYLTMGSVSAPTKNTSDMKNHGIELTATWRDHIGKVNYSISGNFAYNKNKVVNYLGKLKEEWVEQDGKQVYESNLGQVSAGGSTTGSLRLEDHTLDEYYLRTYYKGTGTYYKNDGTVDPQGGPRDGMIRSEADLKWVRDMIAAGNSFNGAAVNQSGGLWYGEYLFADLNGDGNYGNSYDRKFTGKSAIPKYNFGLSVSANWNGLDFSMTWAGAAGFWYYLRERGANVNNISTQTNVLPTDARNMFYYLAYDRETGTPLWDDPSNNLTAPYARLRTGSDTPYAANEQYLYNASYLKLKTLQIGYTLPKAWTDKIYVNRLRVFASGENLLTITDYPGVDPEQGAGLNIYPISRQLSLGVNVVF